MRKLEPANLRETFDTISEVYQVRYKQVRFTENGCYNFREKQKKYS